MPTHDTQAESCPSLLAQAQTYLLRQVAQRGWTVGYVRLVLARPDVYCAEQAMDCCCLTGDVEGLKSACRRWWKAVLA